MAVDEETTEVEGLSSTVQNPRFCSLELDKLDILQLFVRQFQPLKRMVACRVARYTLVRSFRPAYSLQPLLASATVYTLA